MFTPLYTIGALVVNWRYIALSLFDFVRQNIDKVILLIVFIYVFHATLGLIAIPGVDAATIAWAREIAGTVLGGLLGLVTGYAIAKNSAGQGKDGSQS